MTTTAGEIMVVQFVHPGREHVPPADRPIMAWNVCEHRRKFLRTAGRCLDNGGSIRSQTVSVWAEWEAQSRVVERHPGPSGPMPRFVHEPILAVPQGVPVHQNTDPYVFGGSFLYSNCRQFTAQLRPTRLQRMLPGSLLLFGAHLDGQFVLDTLVVVASRSPYTIGPSADLDEEVSPAFRVATLEPLANSGRLRGRTAQLYRGVAHQERRHQRMFSFAPARADGARFCRPTLRRSRFVNPDLTQGFKTTTVTREEAQVVWDDTVAQVYRRKYSVIPCGAGEWRLVVLVG